LFRFGAAAVFLGICLSGADASATAHRRRAEGLSKEVLTKVKGSTVLLKVKLPNGQLVTGSGFFGHEPGLVLTNAHVLGMLDPASRLPVKVEVVLNSGEAKSRTLVGKVLGVDRGTDLGVLRVEGKDLPAPLKVGSADKLTETQGLFVFGFPFGEDLGKNITVAKTTVSSLRKSGGFLKQIQVDGGINPGNSGGPLTDETGLIVGVAVSGVKNTQIHFAIPGQYVATFLNGRLSAVGTHTPFKDGDKVKVPVEVELIDPLGRIKRVAIEVWTAEKGPPRQVASKEPAPMPGDSAKTVLVLTYDKKGKAKGDLILPALAKPNHLYWVRPVVQNGAGETRWYGVGPRTFAPPLERKAVTLKYTRQPGAAYEVELSSQSSFRVRTPDDEDSSLGMNLRALMAEKVLGGDGQETRRMDFLRFGMSILEDNKPIEANKALQKYAQDTRFLAAEVRLDDKGGQVSGRPDLSKVPRGSREALSDISEQILQSLEVLSVPLPGGNVKPLDTWKAKRNLLIGSLGMEVPATVELTYRYQGTQMRDGKPVAVIGLGGTVKGRQGDGLNVGGSVSGQATVLLETGQVLTSATTIKADLDITSRRRSLKAMGTLSVDLKRKSK
jgi:hypothetical protein